MQVQTLNSIPQTPPAEFTSSVRSLVMMLYFTELYVSPVHRERRGLCLEKGAENFQGTMPAEGGEIFPKSFNIQTRSKASRGAPTRGRM